MSCNEKWSDMDNVVFGYSYTSYSWCWSATSLLGIVEILWPAVSSGLRAALAGGLPVLGFPKKAGPSFPPCCPHPPLVSVLLKPYFLSSHQSFCLWMPVSPNYGCFLLPLWAGLWESKLWNPPHHLQGEMVKRAGGPICQAAFATPWYWASSLWHSEGSPADRVQ